MISSLVVKVLREQYRTLFCVNREDAMETIKIHRGVDTVRKHSFIHVRLPLPIGRNLRAIDGFFFKNLVPCLVCCGNAILVEYIREL